MALSRSGEATVTLGRGPVCESGAVILTAIFALLALVVVGAFISLQARRRRYELSEPEDTIDEL